MKTVGQISSLLYATPPYKYVDADATSIVPALNQVLLKLYSEGAWKCLRAETAFDVTAGYIALPPDYESILGNRLGYSPMDVQTIDFEYRRTGWGGVSPPEGDLIGIIDRGYVPLMSDLPDDGLPELVFTLTTGAFASGDEIEVNYTTEDGVAVFTSNPTSGTSVTLTPAANITSIESISYGSLPARVLAQDDPAADSPVLYAILLPGEGVAQFHRYQVPQVTGVSTTSTTLMALCKRAFIPVTGNSSIVYLDNIMVLKYGLLAVIAEDNADSGRAAELWGKAINELEKELTASRGSAITHPIIEPWGRGIRSVASLY